MRLKQWIVIASVALFASGAAVGFVARSYFMGGYSGGSSVTLDGDLTLYLVTSDNIYRELGLSEVQRQQLDGLLAAHYQGVRELNDSMAQLSTTLRGEITGVLTTEQQKRFKATQEEYREAKNHSRVISYMASLRPLLQLRPEQEGPMYQILFDTYRERDKLFRQDPRPSREDFKVSMDEINQRRRERLQQVLSPDQMEKFEEQRRRMKRHWPHRGKRRKNGTKDPEMKKSSEYTPPTKSGTSSRTSTRRAPRVPLYRSPMA